MRVLNYVLIASLYLLNTSVGATSEYLTLPAGMKATLAHGTEKELKAYQHLRELLSKHDVSQFVFTEHVRFKQYEIPHSHRVLTLSTNMVGKDNHALSTFLHEQLHWLTEDNKENVESAILALRKIYPEVPVGNRQGAKSEYSTYLHLVVCLLELEATASLIGKDEARATLGKKRYYQWIYQEILNNTDEITSILHQYSLTLKQLKLVKKQTN